ncbi:cytochrome c oxidase subunit II [Paenibacillus filicis]|uniref:Cytochrome aa3 subunit 2 n=1 Tax=Paenibacillus gyeongsangnamensis TaxID=3388067 RepID=A0ABT4Q9S1_9BACL|nr:cytochrome c oxidase subunit II [Paenibacillus filicis]MCZ8513624.1 cytochrome c oxidase subunit II [Paenibacillus filicis]
MQMHRLEKMWLIFGISMLIVFLAVVGVGAFAMGMTPPGDHRHTVNPETVDQTEPFNHPGLRKIGENEYEAYLLAFAFGYSPEKLEIPKGATVHFNITSKDVVHGFEIVGTTVNMMVMPGEVNHLTYKFDKPGDFLILCNEYCGGAHEYMGTTLTVTG